MDTNKKNYFKFLSILIFSFLVRLIPFRAPNVEIITSSLMPISKAGGLIQSFVFGFASVLMYDIATQTLGIHTLFTSISFGLVGIGSFFWFRNRKMSISNTIRFSIFATIFFDALTGLTIGPIFFNQSFLSSLILQIPFTAIHLLGNIIFAITLSPIIYHFMIRKREVSFLENIINSFNPKVI